MKTDFRRALARLVPVFMPELLFRLKPDGQPLFEDFAAAIVPTEFEPGKTFGTGTAPRPADNYRVTIYRNNARTFLCGDRAEVAGVAPYVQHSLRTKLRHHVFYEALLCSKLMLIVVVIGRVV